MKIKTKTKPVIFIYIVLAMLSISYIAGILPFGFFLLLIVYLGLYLIVVKQRKTVKILADLVILNFLIAYDNLLQLIKRKLRLISRSLLFLKILVLIDYKIPKAVAVCHRTVLNSISNFISKLALVVDCLTAIYLSKKATLTRFAGIAVFILIILFFFIGIKPNEESIKFVDAYGEACTYDNQCAICEYCDTTCKYIASQSPDNEATHLCTGTSGCSATTNDYCRCNGAGSCLTNDAGECTANAQCFNYCDAENTSNEGLRGKEDDNLVCFSAAACDGGASNCGNQDGDCQYDPGADDNCDDYSETSIIQSGDPGYPGYCDANCGYHSEGAYKFYVRNSTDHSVASFDDTGNVVIKGTLIGGDWWNSSWDYRKNITVDNTANGNSLTNYQVFYNVSYDSDMNTSFKDLRFTWYNSSSGQEQEIDYWIENKVDSSYAETWINVTSIAASSKETVYIYYGNSGASSESNGTNTFIIFDNFDDNTLSGWSTEDADDCAGTSFSETSQQMQIDANGNDTWTTDDDYGSVYKSISGDFIAQVKVVSQENTNAWAKAGIMVKNDISEEGSSTGYVFMTITPSSGSSFQSDVTNNGYLETHTTGGGISPYPIYLKLIKSGTTFTGYNSTDGVSWIQAGTQAVSSTQSTQEVGMSVTSHSEGVLGLVKFDDFIARKYTSTEPTTSAGSEETKPYPSGNDDFIIQNSTADWVAWVDGATGNMYLRGTMLDGQTITPPADSFIIQNATGHNMSYIDNSGNLRLKGAFIEGGTP